MTGVLIGRDMKTQRRYRDEGHVRTEADRIYIVPNQGMPRIWQLPETRKGKEGFFPRTFSGRNHSPDNSLILDFQPPELVRK